MATFGSLESPSKLFSHVKYSPTIPTTHPKRNIEREFRSAEKLKLDFETNHHEYKKSIELQSRVEVVLRNNQDLIQENQEMKMMLLMQRNQIDALRVRNSRQLNTYISQEIDNNNYEHRIEVEKLLGQITRLQDQFIFLENQKNREIAAIQKQLQQVNTYHVDILKRSQDGISQAYQLQVQKLASIIQSKQQQIQKLIITHRRQKDLLTQQLQSLNSQFKHLFILKNNQINQLKFGYQSQLSSLQRQARQKQQTQNQAHETVVRRMNRQLNERLNDIERLMNQIKNNNSQYDELYKQMDFEKKKFEQELDAMIGGSKDKIREEKQKMEEMVNKITENLNRTNEIKIKCYEDQSKLLKELLKNRQEDLEKQRQTIVVQRDSYKTEIEELERQNRNLRQKIEFLMRENLSSIEALKVKMASLHQADITGLASIHETRITALSQQLAQKNRQLQVMKKRLHEQMQGKLHLRKQYEVQVAKLKSKIMDLRIQINVVQIQMKDNITSMKSQLDVTSQGLIKDRQTKAKTIKTYQDQMRKLRQTIEAKDQQLILVEQNSAKKEQYYKTQSYTQTEKVTGLKRELEERQKRRSKQLQAKEDEITRLRKQTDNLKSQIVDSQALRKNKIKQLEQNNEITLNKLKYSNHEVQLLKDKIQSLQRQINLARGDIQTVRFQHQAAANQQRSRTRQSIDLTHNSYKQYYQKRIKQLQVDKSELQTINTTQSQQINDLITKYKQLQISLQTLLDSQKKLSNLQTKIIHLGMDDNLVKNFSQLVKRPFH